ncbi:sulfurtransferase [Paeniglutamicibacter terrestris]|uniref:sulfurtransferase n=1 Tax=Paeniglutamicibacter terrestris TaxID=2723403 RepID=UPI001AEBF102|nr:sulfurtransferase [Paeniglutamicibacter terrestris]
MERIHQTLISADELSTLLKTDADVVLLDVRWKLGQNVGSGHSDYLAGHLPTAVFVDLEADLAAPAHPAAGRHPLPLPGDLAASARRWGINTHSIVVLYDATGALAAARGWWLLRHAGLSQVRVLNGGLGAWSSAGLPLETGEVTPGAGNVALGWGNMPVIELEDVLSYPEHSILVDSRAAERYRGEQEPVDPRAGHIPGAVNRATTENLDANQHFVDADILRRQLAELGIRAGAAAPKVAAYCGSGVTAAHQILALESIGVQAALYPGSWSQYCADAARPAATGPLP